MNVKDNKHVNIVDTQYYVDFIHHIISNRYHPLIITLCIQAANLKLIRACHKRYQAIIWCGFPCILLDRLVVHLYNQKRQRDHQINSIILKIFNCWKERCPVNAPVSNSLMNSLELFFKEMPWWIHWASSESSEDHPVWWKYYLMPIFTTSPCPFFFLLVTSTESSASVQFYSAFSASYFMSVLAL